MPKPEYKPNQYFLTLLMKAGFSRRQSYKIFAALSEYISDSLSANKTAQIKGLGTFQVYSKQAASLKDEDVKQEKLIRFYPTNVLKLLVENISHQIITDLSESSNKRTLRPKTPIQKQAVLLSPNLTRSIDEEETPTLPDEELEQIAASIRSELAKEETIEKQELTMEERQAEFDLHYNIGVAYKEMMLYNLAIEDLEKAIKVIEKYLVNDQERHKYIQCCEVLSLCYSGLEDFDQAEKWLLKGIELTKQADTEYKALRYDLALLYEATNRIEQATEAFFDVYSIDINFRRVGQKLKTLQSRYIKKARDERRDKLIPVLVRGKTITGERFEEETLIVNVSRRGAGLRISKEPQPNSFLELRFLDVQRVKVARIVWCSPVNNPVGGFQAGVLIYHEPPK